jgi:hypothetical protein
MRLRIVSGTPRVDIDTTAIGTPGSSEIEEDVEVELATEPEVEESLERLM